MKYILIILIFLSTALYSDDKENFYTEAAVFETSMGNITMTFFDDEAPNHVKNFKDLVKNKFYEGIKFHRVVPDFVIQAGDPNTIKGDRETFGADTSKAVISPEISKFHFKGALAAARLGDDVNPEMNSSKYQFYIAVRPQPQIDGKYTIFGRVAEGFDIVKKISELERDKKDIPLNPPVIKKTWLKKYFDKEKHDRYKRYLEETKK